MKNTIIPVFFAGIWITLSEFIRNELLFKSYWVNHFSSIGLVFETLPINGILWAVWSFVLAYVIYKLLQKFSIKETILLSWLMAFVMMWIVIFNLQVLPLLLLLVAIPLSLIEIFVAVIIIRELQKRAIKFK
jgi:O-antigen/teichoic acid export membrane protein